MEIVNSNPLNEPQHGSKHSRSSFPLEQFILDTHRFGEYHPHLVLDGVSSDSLPFRSKHNTRSYTLRAPLMQDIQMHKDYFLVNLRAILPFQAERFITNPTIGDDIPSDAGTAVEDFLPKIDSLVSSLFGTISSVSDSELIATYYTKLLVFLESIFSDGSLLASLGASLSECLSFQKAGDILRIDDYFDYYMSELLSRLQDRQFTVTIDGDSFYIVSQIPSSVNPSRYITAREFLEKIRRTADWSFPSQVGFPDFSFYSDYIISIQKPSYPLDLRRLWAYHLSCAEFFTDDHVDYIYSADLFRQYISSLFVTLDADFAFRSSLTFTWNGQTLPYDYLSAAYFDAILDDLRISGGFETPAMQYFLTLFGFERSLRYKDYFTGARTRPLAVGDTSIQVNNSQVSVVDISRNIQIQRFLNSVNHSGRKFAEYIKGLFGVSPDVDQHNPIFLAHTTDAIFSSDSENTGNAVFEDINGINTSQNNVTAVFRSQSNNFEFSVDVKEDCTIIGVTSYDIKRSYTSVVERNMFNLDRFDWFLPQLQFVGDQPVYVHELFPFAGAAFGVPFAYQYHDMQYKQLVNRSLGGFATGRLPGYAFQYKPSRALSALNLSPEFIRSKPSELDDFYLSLTGYSLGHYFHFIVVSENTCRASRPMSVQPQILG